jgi:Kef-type K+ transport system membrane component KefB
MLVSLLHRLGLMVNGLRLGNVFYIIFLIVIVVLLDWVVHDLFRWLGLLSNRHILIFIVLLVNDLSSL